MRLWTTSPVVAGPGAYKHLGAGSYIKPRFMIFVVQLCYPGWNPGCIVSNAQRSFEHSALLAGARCIIFEHSALLAGTGCIIFAFYQPFVKTCQEYHLVGGRNTLHYWKKRQMSFLHSSSSIYSLLF